jgi:hypothetical protein
MMSTPTPCSITYARDNVCMRCDSHRHARTRALHYLEFGDSGELSTDVQHAVARCDDEHQLTRAIEIAVDVVPLKLNLHAHITPSACNCVFLALRERDALLPTRCHRWLMS